MSLHDETKNALETFKTIPRDAVPYNPSRDIENSLIGLLKHQIDKLKDSETYINAFQEAIMSRLPEATFMELVDALSRAQASKNSLMEKILSPVIPKAGSTAPLLDAGDKQKPDDEVAATANKETLLALTELTKLMKGVREDPDNVKNDVKKALNLE
jgi:hypothetical protein